MSRAHGDAAGGPRAASRGDAAGAVRPDGFAVLRTPLLPLDELTRLSDAAGDRAAVEAGIARLLARADVRDAIALASPSLAAALAGPLSPKLVRAGYRYLARMCTRPTPFGLFAGTSIARIDARTDLMLAPRDTQSRTTTIDPQVLTALAETLSERPDVRERLRYRPNSSLYRVAGRVRYARARTDGARRTYELAAADATPALSALLVRAQAGVSADELAGRLRDGGATAIAAAGFVAAVIDAQILVGDLVPPVTGADPLSSLIARLEEVAPEHAATLARAREHLARIDAAGVGAAAPARSVHAAAPEQDAETAAARGAHAATPGRRADGSAAGGYEDVAALLGTLPGGADPARALIADLVRPLAADRIGRAVVAEVARAVELVAAMTPRGAGELTDWRAAFEARYEGREVPLAEALDEELGIGFQASTSPSADASPLLRGLPWGATPAEPRFGARSRRLLALSERARGEIEVELTEQDVDALRAPDPAPLPDAFAALVSVARDPDGGFGVRLHGASGPSGARMLGRICHADPAVADAVRAHILREEAVRPDAVFAELVHLPEGSTGKLIARPLLRAHEIEYLGRSGIGDALPLDDLLVSVRSDRIVLRSQRLRREVLPRLTSAHNHARPGSIGTYRFLGALQAQGRVGGAVWSWGALEAAPFLPRVRHRRCVLARARWLLTRDDLAALVAGRGDDAALLRAAGALRERHALPRWIALADADNELVVDLENVVALDTLAHLVAGRELAELVELWPGPDRLSVEGEDGRYVHELVIPFVRAALSPQPATAAASQPPQATAGEPPQPAIAAASQPPQAAAGEPPQPTTAAAAPAAAAAGPTAAAVRRSFLPGSEWLYAKLFAGTATADALLRETVAPLVRDALANGTADRWFFLRYGDPDWHLRVRLRGDCGALLPALHAAAERERATGRLWRLELGTYEREVERYGGPEAIEACEEIFQADSDAVLAILALGATPDERWRLALAGIDMLVSDLLDDRALVRTMRDAYAREHDAGGALWKAIGERWRREGTALRALLDGAADGRVGDGLEALRERSRRAAGAVARLRALDAGGRLTTPLSDVTGSLVHMHVNRLLRSAGRAHELVILDLLARADAARAARR